MKIEDLDDDTRRIFETYLRPLEELPLGVYPRKGGMFFEYPGRAKAGFLVRPAPEHEGEVQIGSYKLYEYAVEMLDLEYEYIGRGRGVAILPDGETFELLNKDQFKAFYRRIHASLPLIGLMSLLGDYVADSGRREEVVTTTGHDSLYLLDDLDLDALPGFTLPEVTENADGSFNLRFCTAFRDDTPSFPWSTVLSRWDASVDAEGRLEWSSRRIFTQV